MLRAARRTCLSKAQGRWRSCPLRGAGATPLRRGQVIAEVHYWGKTQTMNVRLLTDPVPPVTIHCIVIVCEPAPTLERNPAYEMLVNPVPENLIGPGWT